MGGAGGVSDCILLDIDRKIATTNPWKNPKILPQRCTHRKFLKTLIGFNEDEERRWGRLSDSSLVRRQGTILKIIIEHYELMSDHLYISDNNIF